ncbi:MAG TPA: rhomboid family intramembrane serine protease [Vicinamibacteria bacterium]|jgi:membrane associated rhomboid family serine protease|nr:rhomboid family intramembrane serine protease [Vicinamibacteria bacterium]
MAPPILHRNVTVLGQRVPLPVAVLIASVLTASILGATLTRNGLPVLQLGVLIPGLVWSGEVWRLLTWVFFELNPLNLVFGCLALWWFGGPLARLWGPVRFLRISLGIVTLSAGLTCLVALLWPALQGVPYLGIWPLVDALIIAWASLSPYSTVLVFFVFPAQGRMLIYLTVGMTVVYALLVGISGFIPHLVAEGLMLVYFRDAGLRRLWLKLRFSGLERKLRHKTSPLREVGRSQEDRPRWFH